MAAREPLKAYKAKRNFAITSEPAEGGNPNEDEMMMNEAEVEHAGAKDLVTQIQGMSASDPMFDAKVKVLGEYIDHHVKEERTEMFPKARATKVDLVNLKDQMQMRKEELMAELEGMPA